MLRAALVESQSATKSPVPVAPAAATAVIPQTIVGLSPATEHPLSQSSVHVINQDCYMVVANDNDNSAILDLDSFVLDDVMMTDEHEVIDNQLLI